MNELDVYRFIVAYKRKNDGNSPSTREIMEGCRLSSTSVAHFYLDKLERMGLISRPGGNLSRGIVVTGGRWELHGVKEIKGGG